MKIKAFKTLSKYFMKSKDTIIKHGPQIMAVAGVGCFIGATYCAIKETPAAMAKLDEKKALDKDMTTLQKLAVVGPEYKKTAACTAAGIIFTGLSWRFEYKYVGTLLAALSTAEKKSDALVEASKQVVGQEKTAEIVGKAKEIEVEEDDDCDDDEDGKRIPSDMIYYPFAFNNGTVIWMSWKQFNERLEASALQLADNRQLSVYDLFSNMKADYIPPVTDEGWSEETHSNGCLMSPSDYLTWAYDALSYDHEVFEYKPKVFGVRIKWCNKPEKFKN